MGIDNGKRYGSFCVCFDKDCDDCKLFPYSRTQRQVLNDLAQQAENRQAARRSIQPLVGTLKIAKAEA